MPDLEHIDSTENTHSIGKKIQCFLLRCSEIIKFCADLFSLLLSQKAVTQTLERERTFQLGTEGSET